MAVVRVVRFSGLDDSFLVIIDVNTRSTDFAPGIGQGLLFVLSILVTAAHKRCLPKPPLRYRSCRERSSSRVPHLAAPKSAQGAS